MEQLLTAAEAKSIATKNGGTPIKKILNRIERAAKEGLPHHKFLSCENNVLQYKQELTNLGYKVGEEIQGEICVSWGHYHRFCIKEIYAKGTCQKAMDDLGEIFKAMGEKHTENGSKLSSELLNIYEMYIGQFSAITKIPATDKLPEGRYIDLRFVRSIHSIIQILGFDYITISDLLNIIMGEKK